MTSKTFFGILFGVPLATALGIEAASFLIFLDLVRKNSKKYSRKPDLFSLQGFQNLVGIKKGTPKKGSNSSLKKKMREENFVKMGFDLAIPNN